MEEINKPNNVEAFLKIYSKKRPLALYNAEEKQYTSSSKVLKPKEVIATVSKQLRDIQKADIVNKGCVKRVVKPHSSEFVPINVLYTHEGFQHHDINNFETQCVTDTQLIDTVDNVEALVNVKNATSKDKQKTVFNNECHSKNTTKGELVTVCCVNNAGTEYISRDLGDIKPFCNQNDELCVNEINTEIFKEFDASYSEVEHVNICRPDVGETSDNTESMKKDVSGSSSKNIKETEETSFTVKCNQFSNIGKENISSYINEDNKEDLLPSRDNSPCDLYTDFTMENVCGLSEKMKLSTRPIFQNYKPTVKTNILCPLIYPLDTFEKFESLAMPLIEENVDFEAAKNLINSQIIDNQIIISSNTVPTLRKLPHNLLSNVNNCNNANIINEDDTIKTLIDSKETANKSTNFEDEILFSSDEENEYIYYSRKDLPLTCVLKTSFYGPEVDLDETIFVGFQTSSDKCIQVSKDSFVKAKKMFDSIDKEKNNNLTFTELVDSYDSKASHFNNNVPNKEIIQKDDDKDKQNVNNFTNKVLKTATIEIDNVKVSQKEKFDGFKLNADEKSIVISEKALLKCNNIFKDIKVDIKDTTDGLNMIPKKREILQFMTTGNKRIRLSEESSAKATIGEIYQNTPACADFNSTIKTSVNDDYLNLEDQTLLHEFENESIEEALNNEMDCNVLQTVVNKTEIDIKQSDVYFKTSENSFNDKDRVCESDLSKNFDPGITEHDKNSHLPDARKFCGFKSANNKEIRVSSEATAKTKDLFHDFGFEDLNLNNHKRNTDENIGCNFNDDNLIKSNLHQLGNEDPCPIFQGFKTASNKMVQISKEALSRSEKIFKDIDLLCKKDLSTNINSDSVKLPHKNSNVSFTFQGFKTASNKSVSISEEAIFNTKKVFHDLLQHENVIETKFHQLENEEPRPNFQGFKTASNKMVHISKEALSKSEKIFKDVDIIPKENLSTRTNSDGVNLLNKNSNTSFSFQGFKTASNKSVNISEKAIANTKKVFQDLLQYDNNEKIEKPSHLIHNIASNVEKVKNVSNLKTHLGFIGFKTANHKPVIVSEMSLLKTRNFFENIDGIGNNKDKTAGGSDKNELNSNILPSEILGLSTSKKTARVKQIDDTLDKVKLVFDNVDGQNNILNERTDETEKVKNVSNLKTNPGFLGFKTAINKPVIVYEESLLKTRKIFENIDDIINNKDMTAGGSDRNEHIGNTLKYEISDLSKFKTGSYKQVDISNDDLAKATLMFENVDGEDNIFRSKEGTDKENKVNAFKGFQTASNKCVKVSHEAIIRSRKIFDDIHFDVHNNENPVFVTDEDINKENVEFECEKDNATPGFKVLSNKSVVLSERLLKKSKQLADFGNDLKKSNKNIDELAFKRISAIGIENNKILHNTIDTQLLNNFDETLHMEDFYDKTTPKQCKRSSSPILSCPKAKKRKKFETPYRTDTGGANIKIVEFKRNKKSEVQYIFPEHYKKTKLYSLKDLAKLDGNELNAVIDPYVLNFNFDTLLNFEFEGIHNDFTDTRWTTDDIKKCFIESVDHKIIPDGWLDNHLKLILWKLISYEIRFPNVMQNVCTVKNVLDQLKYRYDKELYRVERPALRKLLEKDDISTKTMILAVVGVYVNGDNVPGITNPSSNVELLLTDGWYCVKACTDRMLSRLVSEGKITAGKKIATVGAELLNCQQGVSPWEDTSAVRLKIFGNSTRPASWDARLGFHNKGTILSQLSTIDSSGGKVCKTRALVLRVYPALYVEKLEDGSTVTRSERLEHLHQIKYESERQIRLEKLYEEVEKEFDQELSGSEGMDMELKKSHQTGSQINKLMRKSNDPSQFRSHLTSSQALLLQEYSSRNKEKIVEELQKRVQDKIRAQGLQMCRNVIPLLKIRVAGLEGTDSVKISKGMVSIWRPSDAILDVVKEGTWIDLFNVVPTAVRNSEVQISAGRQSVFHTSKFKEKDKMKPYIESLQRKCFTTKNLNKISTMQTDFNEIDTVGMVFLVEPSLNDFESRKGQQFQNVYLTDLDKNFICINFWGGIKKFGYENIFDTGNVVACMNLQKRAGNTRKTIPQYRATEFTVFTKSPKLGHLRNMIEELIKKLSGLDKRKFCDDCVLIKNNYATIKYSSEISPYRFNTSDYNLARNKMFIDSPLVQNKDVNLNLSGLDFESTFQQADTKDFSPAILKQKQVAKEKMAKLKMYGEPPPISKIHIINKSKNAGSAFKSPLTSNVTRLKNSDDSPITTNKIENCSPVLSMNRTFVVKSVMNPVKLNFSSTSVGDEKTEPNPFEEEFEASPPLSLE